MELATNAVSYELSDDPKSPVLDVGLNGVTDVSYPFSWRGLSDAFV